MNREVWAAAAYDVLVEVAGTWNAVIDYSALGAQIQERSGQTTRMGIQHWIGPVLDIVVHRCVTEGIPPLTSLVVRKTDRKVGHEYDVALVAAGIEPRGDVQQRETHASVSRIECYRWAGAVEAPVKTAAATKRASSKAPAREVKPEPVVKLCPNCFVQLPATGVCDCY